MSTIRETIENAVPYHAIPSDKRDFADQVVGEVVQAAEAWVSAIVEALRAYADGKGLDRTEQDRILSNAGLGQYVTVEMPDLSRHRAHHEPTPTPGSPAARGSELGSIYARLDRLERAARRAGVTV